MLTNEQRELAEKNMHLCQWYVHKRAKHRLDIKFARVDLDEMMSIAYYALCKAVRHYDPQKGIKFSAYAVRAFDNEFNEMVRKTYSKKHKPYYESDSLDRMFSDDGLDIGEVTESGEPTPEELICSMEGCKCIVETIKRVASEKQKSAIQMYYQGMKQPEIARRIGISQSGVSRCLREAKNEVIDELIKNGYEDCVGM